MNQAFDDVRKFHWKFNIPIASKPMHLSTPRRDLRVRLLQEEMNELRAAVDGGSVEDVADALADIVYIAIGTSLEYGIDLRTVWKEVHGSNMRKTGGGKRADGKVLKPKGWKGPDIRSALSKGDANE